MCLLQSICTRIFIICFNLKIRKLHGGGNAIHIRILYDCRGVFFFKNNFNNTKIVGYVLYPRRVRYLVVFSVFFPRYVIIYYSNPDNTE